MNENCSILELESLPDSHLSAEFGANICLCLACLPEIITVLVLLTFNLGYCKFNYQSSSVKLFLNPLPHLPRRIAALP